MHAHYLTAQGYYNTAHSKALASEEDHRVIFEAICDHDAHLAAATVEKHIHAAQSGLLTIIDQGGTLAAMVDNLSPMHSP